MLRFVNSCILLMRIGSESVYHNIFVGSSGKGPTTGILNSIVFQKIPTVDFDFVAISILVCDGMLLRCLSRSVMMCVG
jgi:hypothetical protein